MDIEIKIEDSVAGGMSLAEARRDANIRFGNRVSTQERVVGEDVALMIESIWQDVRFAMRQLIKNPGFAVTAILVLALGIGASVALFAFVDAALIKPLHRSAAWLAGGFAGLAILLSLVGFYGVIAYSVTQRTREIGVRMALGAERSSVSRLILKEAARLIATGPIAGMVCAVGAAVLGKKLLFGTQAWDHLSLLELEYDFRMSGWLLCIRFLLVSVVCVSFIGVGG